jgi:toxin ParE1/3/4
VTKIDFARDAERDLIDIFLYGIEHFGPAQAERYLETLNAKIEMAAEHPDFGADYSFVLVGVRRHEAISHAMYYRSTRPGILVLRVLHGRMDPPGRREVGDTLERTGTSTASSRSGAQTRRRDPRRGFRRG